MKWAHFLHIYQPHDQHPGILDKIVNESYRPLFKGLYKIPKAKLTLNINGVLVELLFHNGYRDVIQDIKNLIELGKLELTGSAKYHAFLPLLPESEVVRQIKLNEDVMLGYFGDLFKRKGFFPPEMGYSPKVAKIVKDFGYEWILIDEVSICKPGEVLGDRNLNIIYEIEGLGLNVFFREKHPSNIIMGALVRSAESFENVVNDRLQTNSYSITAMDGETLGHHRPGFEEAFFDILSSDKLENVLISELENYFENRATINPKDSSWVPSADEVARGDPYNLWLHSDNVIHKYLWELVDLAVRTVKNSKFSDEKYPRMLEEDYNWDELTKDQQAKEEMKRRWVHARGLLDKSLNSDPMWWASAKPWWSIEQIERGGNALFNVVIDTPDSSLSDKNLAEELYKKILFTAHEWQRSGLVDRMAKDDSRARVIPLSKRFAAKGHYLSLLKALRDEELKCSQNREYEQAIKWRDSQYKLERDLDVYDAVHVLDLFRAEGDFKRFEEYLSDYRKQYRALSKGQPE